MITTMHRINESGIWELHTALLLFSTIPISATPTDAIDAELLAAWAEKAEAALDDGFAAQVEIPARLSRSGAACVVYLDSAGFDAFEVDLGGDEQ